MRLSDDVFNNVCFFVLESHDNNNFSCIQLNKAGTDFFKLPYPLTKSYDFLYLTDETETKKILKKCALAIKKENIHDFPIKIVHNNKAFTFLVTLSSFVYNKKTYILGNAIIIPYVKQDFNKYQEKELNTSILKDPKKECTLELIKSNNEYHLFCFSDCFRTKIVQKDNIISTKLSHILPKREQEFLTSCADKCLEEGYFECEAINYEPDGTPIYNKLTFTPITRLGLTTVLCYKRDCTNDAEISNNFIQYLQIYELLFSTSCSACFFLEYNNHNEPTIIQKNDSMLEFEQLHKKNLNDFLNSEPFILLHYYKVPLSTNAYLKGIDNLVHHYQLFMVPIMEKNKVWKLFVSIKKLDNLEIQLKKFDVHLTKREYEILSYVMKGYKNRYIATCLGISEGTVKRTLSNAYAKLNITSRTELMKYYFDISNSELN